MTRAQANLVSVAVALVLLTAAVVVAVGAAGTALDGRAGDPLDRRAATALAERLVDADGPLAVRPNVLPARTLRRDAGWLRDHYPSTRGRDVAVRVGERYEMGAADGGATVRRVVLVATRKRVERRPLFAGRNATVDLPPDTVAATVHVRRNESVTRVAVEDRVAYRNATGLHGDYRVSTREAERLRLDARSPVPPGTVVVTCVVEETRPAVLVVTVDA